MNGQLIASKDAVAGAYCRYAFDVTKNMKRGRNAIAVEVFPPTPGDLAINWVDWNPTPPDKNMGLWGAVSVTTSGPVKLRYSYIRSVVDTRTLASADLIATTEAINTTDARVSAEVTVAIDGRRVSKTVSLAPRQSQAVEFTAAGNAALHVDRPRLWWPYRMGAPNLYTATITATVNGGQSDREDVRFGIRQATSELTTAGHRLFKINGKPILIRGGGWASDMMLRATREQIDAHMRYVREMGLNTIRQEGKLEPDAFYDRADELGILVMPGWCCCDIWEMWESGTRRIARRAAVAPRSTAAAAQPSERVRLAERQRQAADGRGRAHVSPDRGPHANGSADGLERGGAGRPGQRAERRQDARPVQVRPPHVLAARHEEWRRLRLRHRDRSRRRGPADRKPGGDAAERQPLADRSPPGTSTPAAASSRTSTTSRRRSKRGTARPPTCATTRARRRR